MDLIEQARAAVLPWFSIDAIAEEWERAGLPVVKPSDVARCMDCRAEDCFNCIGGCTGRKPSGRPRLDKTPLNGQMGIF